MTNDASSPDHPAPATTAEAQDCCALSKRRCAAGENPRKRDQIINGAWKMFMEQGYDAASMNKICKAAGVSKGTLYVYFQNKEDLFVETIAEKRLALFQGLRDILHSPGTTEQQLLSYGIGVARLMTSEEAIRAQRMVIGIVERMPELGLRFYEFGARRFLGDLYTWLEDETRAGRLKIDDPLLAAQQFIELTSVGIWRKRLFGQKPEPPTPEEIQTCAQQALRVFMAAYGG
ncbi:TetR/AcrR family transcriptional regulator [Pseudodonghicola xiamenensis]|uniref:TetR family transcriptional regulator n=1 Tax=Pseudodonghicola xiamenensis TaxID=337702 RepID=A0A8J3H6P4_9RHOB|nr:TetR/AcrR family transcriptional regulator [Pseudodonghicola xiamenensis]GHG93470.1 TetR family transcriptional regulator [Pseudodonghicola xiamenensis]